MRKLLLSFLASLIILFSFAPYWQVSASSPTWYNQGLGDWFLKVYDTNNPQEIFGERYTAAQVQWVIYGLYSNILNFVFGPKGGAVIACAVGSIGQNQQLSTCIGPAVTELFADAETQSNLAVGPKQNLLSLVFADRYFSGISYTRTRLQNFRLIPEVKAQSVGFGFDALKPVQDMWRASRNVAFGLFVLATITFAFMIMFRIKIDPQTVVTVQSAIPKIVISLILVTFSYAIAGFMVDLMYVVIGLLSVILTAFLPFNVDPAGVFSYLTLGQPFGAIGINIQTGIFGALAMILLPLLLVITIFIFALIAGSGGFLFWVAFAIPVLVALALIWMCLKIIWALLKAFVNILLLTIFAPIQLAIGILIPNFGFGQWLKSFASYLSVFIVTGALLFLSIVFLIQGVYIGFSGIPAGDTIAVAVLKPILGTINPVIPAIISGSPWPPLLGSGNAQGVGLLFLGVSFVLFTMIPKATDVVQAIMSGKPFAYGSAIGEAMGPIMWGGKQLYAGSGIPDVISDVRFGRSAVAAERLMSNKFTASLISRLMGVGYGPEGREQAREIFKQAQRKREEQAGRV